MSWTTQGGYSCNINPDPTWFYNMPYPNSTATFSICSVIAELDLTLDDTDFEDGDTSGYKTVRVEYDYTFVSWAPTEPQTGIFNFFIQPSQTSLELVNIASTRVRFALYYPLNGYQLVIDNAQIYRNNGEYVGQIYFNQYQASIWSGGWEPESSAQLWDALKLLSNNFGSDPGPHFFDITLVHAIDESESSESESQSESQSESSLSGSQSESSLSEITTTTTALSPIRVVETVFMEKTTNGYVERIISDASNSEDTKNTPFAKAFNFGTVAPKEVSKTLPIFLRIPNTEAIRNVQLGLTNAGGITFTSNVFGITTSKELRDDIIPDAYFQGLNTNNSATSTNNVSINNNSEITTDYVYLNLNLPEDNFLGEGVVRYQFFFDYYD